VIDKLPPVNRGTVVARLLLSEDLHDRQREAEAAEVLKPIVELVESDKNAEMRRLLEQMDRPLAGIKSRMLYFEACAVLQEGDADAHARLLEQAVASDPADADVLIALYRLPNQTAAQRSRTQSLIDHAAEESRQMIEEVPDDATAYNQLAWLVGNTGGDVDEAIAMSHKSIEIRRAGGYLDTLAHCYFAKGDYENAVKYQTEAAELEPHSQLISRQLNVFKQALEKSHEATPPTEPE
jgi:tetratricopeptide (TPR) repeat protein